MSKQKRHSGLLITLEGIDFSGKSSQAQLLFDKLREKVGTANQDSVLLLREPGGTPISERIRAILLDRSLSMMAPMTELLLYEAARTQLIAEIILPALEKGQLVICDRFYDSSTAYQGYARGIPLTTIKQAHEIATLGIRPDVTFVIDLDPIIAMMRQKNAGRNVDRMESEGLAFYQSVRQGFLQIAQEEPDRVIVVDGSQTIGAIFAEIWRIIQKKIR